MLNKITDNFNLQSIFMRRAIRIAIAIFISTCVYRYFSLTQGFWVPLTTVIVMQATTAATLRKGLQRFLGAIIGIIIGSLLMVVIHNHYWIDALLVFSFFITYYLKAFNLVNYGVFVVAISFMVVFLVSAIVPHESGELVWARLYDTALGAFIGVLITLLILPNSLKHYVDDGIKKTIATSQEYFTALMECFSQVAGSQLHADELRDKFIKCLSSNRMYYPDWIYESWRSSVNKHSHQDFLNITEKMGQFLFSIHHLARQESLPLEILAIDIEGYRQCVDKLENSFYAK